MAPILGYWNIRGLCQHIRMILEYTGEEYTEKSYKFGPPPDYDSTPSWYKGDKLKLDLDFPNLPYYIDGDVKITQSNAILRYIARKHGLIGKTEKETIKADILENETMDLRMGFLRICHDSNFEKLKGPFITDKMIPKLEQFSKCLGDNDWFLGSHLSYVDFFIYETIDCLRFLVPTCLDKHDNLNKFMSRFENLELIKKYMNSSRFMKGPISAPMAYFGIK